MLIRKRYSVWRVSSSALSKSKFNFRFLEDYFFTGKPFFEFVCSTRDISAFSSDIVFCNKINSANEYLVFVR